jgi:hypothetical protein
MPSKAHLFAKMVTPTDPIDPKQLPLIAGGIDKRAIDLDLGAAWTASSDSFALVPATLDIGGIARAQLRQRPAVLCGPGAARRSGRPGRGRLSSSRCATMAASIPRAKCQPRRRASGARRQRRGASRGNRRQSGCGARRWMRSQAMSNRRVRRSSSRSRPAPRSADAIDAASADRSARSRNFASRRQRGFEAPQGRGCFRLPMSRHPRSLWCTWLPRHNEFVAPPLATREG